MNKMVYFLLLFTLPELVIAQVAIPSSPSAAMRDNYGSYGNDTFIPGRFAGNDEKVLIYIPRTNGSTIPSSPGLINPSGSGVYNYIPSKGASEELRKPTGNSTQSCNLPVFLQNAIPDMDSQIRDYLGENKQAISKYEKNMPTGCEKKFAYLSNLLQQIVERG
jgi:hypothetical protein